MQLDSRRRWLLLGTWSHLWFAEVRECPQWCSIVGATVTVHQFFCILHLHPDPYWNVDNERLLGVRLDNSLQYTKHIDEVGRSSKVALLKAGHFWYKQPTNKLKIRILSETSIPYLIRHASFILIVRLHMWRCLCQQANIVWRKIVAHRGLEPATFGFQV